MKKLIHNEIINIEKDLAELIKKYKKKNIKIKYDFKLLDFDILEVKLNYRIFDKL